jgi:glycosyltransferase involved in cell wall biosynthesis
VRTRAHEGSPRAQETSVAITARRHPGNAMTDGHDERAARNRPRFTVVICTYNRADVLPRAIETVLAQSFTDFELVVVDDGSTDATGDVVRAIRDERVRYVRQDNAGLGGARNTGVAHAAGRYVVFLDDDDIALPGWLAGLDAGAGEDCVVVCCGEELADDDGRLLETHLPAPMGSPFADFTALFVPGTFAVRPDAYEAAGGFVVGLAHLHHNEFALRLLPLCASRGWRVCTVDEPLVRRHVHEPEANRHRVDHMLSATTYIVDHHEDRLALLPSLLAQYCAIAGVAAVRTGDYRRARSFFRRAMRADPRSWKHRARFALALVPPLASLVWHGRRYQATVPAGA